MDQLWHDFDFDGVVWGEPKFPHYISCHPDTLARYGGELKAFEMETAFGELLSELIRQFRDVCPGGTVTVFSSAVNPVSFSKIDRCRLFRI